MRNLFTTLCLCILGLSSYGQKFADESNPIIVPEIEYMFEAVIIESSDFPSDAYQVTHGAEYVNKVQQWIISHPTEYAEIVNKLPGYNRITVLRSEYMKLNSDQQLAFKNWFLAIEPFFNTQQSSNNQSKIYLISRADYNQLVSLIKK